MPSGRTHLTVSRICLLPVAAVLWFGFHWYWYHVLLVVLGMWLGELYLSPDLDTRSRPFYRWGLLRFIWWPYQWLVRHRSMLSHHIWVGTFFRLLYFSAVCILLYMSVRKGLDQAIVLPQLRVEVLTYIRVHLTQLGYLGFGVWLGSFLHIVLDEVLSWLKRTMNRL